MRSAMLTAQGNHGLRASDAASRTSAVPRRRRQGRAPFQRTLLLMAASAVTAPPPFALAANDTPSIGQRIADPGPFLLTFSRLSLPAGLLGSRGRLRMG